MQTFSNTSRPFSTDLVAAGLGLLGLLLAGALAPRPAQAQTPTTTIQNGNADTRLQLNYDGGLYVPGTFGPTTPADSIPAEGGGTRLMWYPAKAAFRAGRVGLFKDGTQWDASKVGDYSAAFGLDTKASGRRATAMGFATTASGANATAMGEGTAASGDAATAMGSGTTASGTDATAMGQGTTASSVASLSIGEYNSANSGSSGDGTLFVAGNGSGFSSRSDALVLKRGGDFGLSVSDPAAHLHVRESVRETGATNLGRHAGVVENTSSESGADVFALKTALNDPRGVTNFISFLDADEQVGTIQGNGSGGIEITGNSADYAEELPVEEGTRKPEAGEIVGVRGGEASLETSRADRVMIASEAPIMTGNATPSTKADDDRRVAVAFVGQVPAKTRGPAEVGDLIVASGQEDGTARAVSTEDYRRAEHGPIAGQAWAQKTSEEVGEVTVAVGLGRSGAVAEQLKKQRRTNRKQRAQIEDLEKRLAALEQQNASALPAGLTAPWALTVLLGLGALGAGLLWRRRT